jgi:hypothetical protein
MRKHKKSRTDLTLEMEFTGDDCFVVFQGVRIAKRGHPGTAWAKTWISLEPGWRVLDTANLSGLVIEKDGTVLQ